MHYPSSFRRILAVRVVVALTALLVASASCGGSSAVVSAPSAPSPAASSWVAAAIGSAPDLSIFARPSARADAYWGPLLARLLAGSDHEGDFISHGSGMMVLNARQIDMHFTLRDPIHSKDIDPRSVGWVGILHGLMPLDPLSLRSGAGRPLFAAPSRLPSGVVMYPPDPEYLRTYSFFAPTLFITTDGTAIVTEQVSAPRTRDLLSQYGAPPPALQAPAASLAGATFGITSMRFLSAGKSDKTAVMQGAVVAGFGLRGGANGAVDGYVDYASTDDAERAYAALIRTCAERKDQCVFEPGLFRDAKAEREGRRIVVTLAFSDKLLRSLQQSSP